jgi:WW domain-binding protein 4
MTAPLASTSSTSRKPAPKPSNPYANYSTAASLGYADPDAERLAAEAEYRRTQGVAGDWEVVTSSSATPVEMAAYSAADTLKRSADMAMDEEDAREFKLRKKILNRGLGEIYDPGMIPIKLKKEPTPPPEASAAPLEQPSVRPEAPKWTSVRWRRADEVKEEDDERDSDLAGRSDSAPNVEDAEVRKEKEPVIKREELAVKEGLPTTIETPGLSGDHALSSADNTRPKPEGVDVPALSATDSTSSLFRKRKTRPNGMKGKA